MIAGRKPGLASEERAVGQKETAGPIPEWAAPHQCAEAAARLGRAKEHQPRFGQVRQPAVSDERLAIRVAQELIRKIHRRVSQAN